MSSFYPLRVQFFLTTSLGYYLVFTPLSTWWGERLTAAGVNEYLVLIGTMLVNFITEYLFCRFFIYRRSMDTRPEIKGE